MDKKAKERTKEAFDSVDRKTLINMKKKVLII